MSTSLQFNALAVSLKQRSCKHSGGKVSPSFVLI